MKKVSRASLLMVFCLVMGIGTAVNGTANDLSSATFDVLYKTEFGAVDVGTSQATWQVADDKFSMQGGFKSEGIATLFADFEGYVSVKAVRQGQSWQGQRIDMASIYKSKSRTSETFWSADGKIASTTLEPPLDLEKVYPLNDAMMRGVTDPFSAMMTMLARLKAGGPCIGTFQIYDGRRRAELRFTDYGTRKVIKDRDFAYQGTAIVCGVESKPIGGHRRKSRFGKTNDDKPRTRAYIADMGNGVLVPVRMETTLFFGRIITRLDLAQSNFQPPL